MHFVYDRVQVDIVYKDPSKSSTPHQERGAIADHFCCGKYSFGLNTFWTSIVFWGNLTFYLLFIAVLVNTASVLISAFRLKIAFFQLYENISWHDIILLMLYIYNICQAPLTLCLRYPCALTYIYQVMLKTRILSLSLSLSLSQLSSALGRSSRRHSVSAYSWWI